MKGTPTWGFKTYEAYPYIGLQEISRVPYIGLGEISRVPLYRAWRDIKGTSV